MSNLERILQPDTHGTFLTKKLTDTDLRVWLNKQIQILVRIKALVQADNLEQGE
jgi:hypothetical protein